jgi:glycerophosphoryl diester phosphodiesterase
LLALPAGHTSLPAAAVEQQPAQQHVAVTRGGRVGVVVVAHRGANREAPENTLEAFERAIEIGVQGIELDIQFTRDRVPVVVHDRNLPSTRNPISSLTVDDVRSRSSVPTVDEVLEVVNGRCQLYIEIKAPSAVESVVERLATRRSWCSVHAFDHRVVAKARLLDPQLRTGILLVSYLIDVGAAMRAAGARDLWQQADYIDRELVERVHDAQGRIFAWTVNDVARAQELASLGVDAICTDSPREMMGELTSR